MNFANSTVSQKQSNAERLMRCIIYSPHWLRTILLFVVKSAFYILTLAWGFRRCISVVHWKTIFLICYLLDYQQVQENSNVSIILLGDKKEPTKWKTNLVQQILLPNTIFPVTFTSRTIFTGGKKKDVLLVYGCQPKPIHKYKFIHLRIYILMDWMNWTNCGAIAQPCHVQYWVVALFLSASKNSCMISVTFHL